MRPPTILTTKIEGIAWSFGYAWQSATSAASLKTDAEKEASLAHADVVALRPDPTHPQFGLGSLAPTDRKAGMVGALAFASELAKLNIRAAIALFQIPGGYWLVAVHNDTIDDDLLYSTLAEASEVFERRIPAQKWGKVYLPKSLLTSYEKRADELRLNGADGQPADAFLLANKKLLSTAVFSETFRAIKVPTHRQPKIRRVDVAAYALSRPALAAYALLGGAGVIWLGIGLYHHFTTKTVVVTQEVAPPPPPPPAPPPPPLRTPEPSAVYPASSAMLAWCFAQFAQIDDHLPWGWEDTTLTCVDGRATGDISRTSGTLKDVEAAYPRAHIIWGEKYNTATVEIVTSLAQTARAELLDETESIRKRLTALGWATNEGITVGFFAPPPGRQSRDLARWQQADLSIVTATDPTHWGPVLDNIPGIAIHSLAINAKTMKSNPASVRWEIKGVVYGQ